MSDKAPGIACLLLAVTPDVIAVVRWGDFPLYDTLKQEGCQVTMFRDAARGMGASLAHGVAEARAADGWVVALADMPRIFPATIRSVIAALAGGMQGWVFGKTTRLERWLLIIAGLFLVYPRAAFDYIGLALLVAVIVVQKLRKAGAPAHEGIRH